MHLVKNRNEKKHAIRNINTGKCCRIEKFNLLLKFINYLMIFCCVLLFSIAELPDQAPQVVVELSNTEAYEGNVGRFKCKFQGQPEPQIKWYVTTDSRKLLTSQYLAECSESKQYVQ